MYALKAFLLHKYYPRCIIICSIYKALSYFQENVHIIYKKITKYISASPPRTLVIPKYTKANMTFCARLQSWGAVGPDTFSKPGHIMGMQWDYSHVHPYATSEAGHTGSYTGLSAHTRIPKLFILEVAWAYWPTCHYRTRSNEARMGMLKHMAHPALVT